MLANMRKCKYVKIGGENIAKKVKCPVCNNKRLMDMVSAKQAEVEIKCPICKNTIHLTFHNNKIKAKAV